MLIPTKCKVMKSIYTIHGKYSDELFNAFRFCALSVNLIDHSTKKDYDLSRLTRINDARCSDDFDQVSHSTNKKEYKYYVIGGLIASIIEAFCYFIDETLAIMKKKFPNSFMKYCKPKNNTVDCKLNILMKLIEDLYSEKCPLLEITKSEIDAIISIRKARNIFIHNNGIVNEKGRQNRGKLIVEWFDVKDFVWSKYSKEFKINEKIALTEREAFKIGYFFYGLSSTLIGNLRLLFDYDYPYDTKIYFKAQGSNTS